LVQATSSSAPLSIAHIEPAPGSATRDAQGAARLHDRHGRNVLVVEDNPVNQKVAQRFLERLGCRVTLAVDGAKGVSAFEGGRFDLVLMDLQMPELDGFEATRRIRELERGRSCRIPVVALTANAMSGQAELCTAAGMDGLLAKPIDINQLRATLDRYTIVSGNEIHALAV
jgi:two-component system, sensor histidine kinase and response regulator